MGWDREKEEQGVEEDVQQEVSGNGSSESSEL